MADTLTQPQDAEKAERCGTYAAAQQHRKRKEPLDQACKDATRDYMRDFRSRRGPGSDRWWNSTRSAALQRLAEEYPQRFAELLDEIRAESAETPWDPS